MWGNCDDIGAPPPPGTAPAEPPERQSASYIKRNQMGGAGDRAGASQQQRRALPRGDHPCSEGSEEDRAMHAGLLLEQDGSAATSGRTARSAESGAPDAAPGPHKLREAAADCLPGGGNRDSRTWPRPDIDQLPDLLDIACWNMRSWTSCGPIRSRPCP